MKVTFKYGIRTFSGTLDEMTFGSYRDGNLCIGRDYVIPKLTDNNTLMGSVMKNLATIYGAISTGYKTDLKLYATRRAASIPTTQLAPNGFATFVKMMYCFSDLGAGHIDLASVTYEDLETVGAEISTVALAISNGYLHTVSGADELSNLI